MLSKEKIEYFRKKLETWKKKLEKELSHIGRKNPNVPGDWEPTLPDMNIMVSDKNEKADVFEEFENRAAIEDKFEEQLISVNDALEKAEKGTYGICEICKEPIEEKRLNAFPSANSCVKHAGKQKARQSA
jgi:RNA polymerase-binding transcription factor DksA